MRSDVRYVIVEKPRDRFTSYENRYNTYQRQHARDTELVYGEDEHGAWIESNAPSRMFMARRSKELTDLLAPIRGWARKSIGRLYDDVWSELCSNLRGGSTMIQHVKDHAREFIVPPNQVLSIDGILHSRYFLGGFKVIEPGKIYTDPDDGIVKRMPGSTKRVKHNSQRLSSLPEMFECDREIRINGKLAVQRHGIWYWCEVEMLGSIVLDASFRQFSSQDLRRNALRNVHAR